MYLGKCLSSLRPPSTTYGEGRLGFSYQKISNGRKCNDYPKGVGPSGSKRSALVRGDDIVWSAWGHAAVHKRTGLGLAHQVEHIVKWVRVSCLTH